jgi:hypothetical protein
MTDYPPPPSGAYPPPPPGQPLPQSGYQRFHPPARVGSVLQVTAIMALILVGAACLEAAGPWVGPADAIRVGVAGDSQVHAAQYGPGLKEPDDPDHHVTNALNAAGYRASVAGTIGSNTRDLVNWPAWPEPGAQTVVLAYGANDMNSSATGEPAVPIAEAEANMRGFVERVDPPDDGVDVCVVLVEMPELAVAWGHDVWGPPWNAVLATIADVVVPWSDLTEANPGYLGSDLVHQTPEGRAAYVDAIVAGVQACP